jgi:hypothetical protein
VSVTVPEEGHNPPTENEQLALRARLAYPLAGDLTKYIERLAEHDTVMIRGEDDIWKEMR